MTGPPARRLAGPDRESAALRALLGLLLVGALALAVALSRGRAFQVDEVEHVHVAYNLVDGRVIYRDFWEGHNPLLYALLAPFVDPEDAVGSFRRARVVPFAVLLATAATVAWTARRMFGEAAAWLAGGAVLTHSTMVGRGIEVRPDGLLGLAVAAAFALEVSDLPARRRSILAALVLGLGFVATQKAAFACAAFGLVWAWRARRERRWRTLLEPAAAGLAPLAALLLWLGASGALAAYWQANVGDALRRLGRTALPGSGFGPEVFLAHEAVFNLAFSALAAAALAAALWRAARRRLAGAELGLSLLALLQFASLWLNPFPYPYLHVSVLPTLALLAAGFATRPWRIGAGGRRVSELLVVSLLLALQASTAMPRLARQLRHGNATQLATLAEVQRITGEDETVFDLAGLYFRRDAYRIWVMTGIMLERYYAGGFPPMVPQLERSAPTVVTMNYRTGYLRGAERRFIAAHYVHHDGPIFVHGAAFERLEPGEERSFRALRSLRFRWEGDAPLLVDGSPFVEGELAAGEHRLAVTRAVVGGRLVPARATRSRPPVRPMELFPPFD